MLKKLVNEAIFTLRITSEGPLLIKSGYATVSGPDMAPVKTNRNGKQEIFLPGSSLKGVFRSHSERIVCSIKSHVVCYPFSGSEEQETDIRQRRQDYRDSCGATFYKKSEDERKFLEKHLDQVYLQSCPTCRLFGSTWFIGRLAIGDAYLAPKEVEVKEQRDGVGIDRLTGGAYHSAKFDLEVVSSGVSFETDIHLRNFETWQLGMLFAVIQDMEDGLLRIGSGRARGLGRVKAKISSGSEFNPSGGVVFSTMRGTSESEPSDQLWGLGRWLNDGSYGTLPGGDGDVLELEQPVERKETGIRYTRVFAGTALDHLRHAAIEQFIKRMESWTEPPGVVSPTTNRHS